MFTGIIRHIGTVVAVRRGEQSCALTIEAGALAEQVSVGDSVNTDGACLTATAVEGTRLSFDVSAETLRLTTLGELRPGDRVNLEPALRVGDRVGGHFVSGHVDGVGSIGHMDALPGEVRMHVEVESRLTDDMIMKGSVAVDGVSLTIAALGDGEFEVSLIRHTMAQTTLQFKRAGDRVNVECDMIGRWVSRLLRRDGGRESAQLSISELEEQGF